MSAAVRKDFCTKFLGWAHIRFICAVRTTVRQVTLASRSANQDPLNHQDLSVKLHLNINEKRPGLVWPLAVTLISLAVTIEHELGNRLTQQRYVHGKYEFFSHCLRGDSLQRGGRHLNGAAQHFCFPQDMCSVTAFPQRKPSVFTRKFREDSQGARSGSTVPEYLFSAG